MLSVAGPGNIVEMATQDLKKFVSTTLRSVTQSCKEGVPLDNLQRDYKTLVGNYIPYKDMGYSSLEDMLRNMNDVVFIAQNQSGQHVAKAVANEATSHIASLVAKQKSSSRQPMRQKRRPSRYQQSFYSSSNILERSQRAPDTSRVIAHHQPVPKEDARMHHREMGRIQTHTPIRSRGRNETPPRFRKQQQQQQQQLQAQQIDYEIETNFEIPLQNLTRHSSKKKKASQLPKETAKSQLSKETFKDNSNVKYQATNQKTNSGREVVESYASKSGIVAFYRTMSLGINANISTTTLVLGEDKFSVEFNSEISKEEAEEKVSIDAIKALGLGQYCRLSKQETMKEIIENYAKKNGISISYKTQAQTKGKRHYYSTLILGTRSFLSYPTEKSTKEEAEEEAAKEAVNALGLVQEKTESYPTTPTDTQEDIDILINRISVIVAEKPNGIWNNSVPDEYSTKFKESLPNEWLSLVKLRSSLRVSEIGGTRSILYPPSLNTSGRNTPSSTSSKTSADYEDDESNETPPLKYPDSDCWDVLITYVINCDEIALRLVDHSEEYSKMVEKMQMFYHDNDLPVLKLVKGKLYAANYDNLWCRVKVYKIHPNDQVLCYFVDDGDSADININELQELDATFLQLSIQINPTKGIMKGKAFPCKLEMPELYSKIIEREILVEYLLGKILVAVIEREDEMSVTLYDTATAEDINLNQLLWEMSIKKITSFELPEVGTTAIAFVTHVTPDGAVYLRMKSDYMSIIEQEIESLSPEFEKNANNLSPLSKKKMYCARYEDDIWYRAVITNTCREHQNEVEVMYVDYGNTCFVSQSQLCELDLVSKVLSTLQYQAVKCNLSGVPFSPNVSWPEEAIKRLKELTPEETDVVVKMETAATGMSPPKIQLFRRTFDSTLISINETLAFAKNLFCKSSFSIDEEEKFNIGFVDQASNLSSPVLKSPVYSPTELSLNVLSDSIPDVALPAVVAEEQMTRKINDQAHSLQAVITPEGSSEQIRKEQRLFPAEIPEIGEYFDVLVTLSCSPYNFYCQPWKQGAELDQLIQNMQQFYSSEENICEMHQCLLKEGQFYAGKHEDGLWYRVRVKNIFKEDPLTVSVYFVDYGDYNVMNMNQIQPLWNEFMTLPCQAFRASLAGIQPVHGDWQTMDGISFEKMVKDRQFVSLVKGKRPDPDSDVGSYQVDLILIDTTIPNKDIYIHEELIKEGIAKSS